jgi:hypothetical protein
MRQSEFLSSEDEVGHSNRYALGSAGTLVLLEISVHPDLFNDQLQVDSHATSITLNFKKLTPRKPETQSLT